VRILCRIFRGFCFRAAILLHDEREQRKGAKNPARPSAAAKHWDFEQEETEKTEVIALLSVISVDSCSKKCAQPAHVLTFCSAEKNRFLCDLRSSVLSFSVGAYPSAAAASPPFLAARRPEKEYPNRLGYKRKLALVRVGQSRHDERG
jgi:hypothetical protein